MRKQILALALSVAVCGALLSDTALAAEAPSAMGHGHFRSRRHRPKHSLQGAVSGGRGGHRVF